MTWCEDWPAPPWWRKLLWRLFPWTKPKRKYVTVSTLKLGGQLNQNGDVYPETLRLIMEQDSLTERCLGETGYSMSVVCSQKGKRC